MARILRMGLMCGLAFSIALCGLAGTLQAQEQAPPPGEAPKPALTPEQQAAQDYLERYKKEMEVKREMQLQEAKQNLDAGIANFEMGAFSQAKTQFEKALELDPTNKQAQEYLRKARSMLNLEERKFGDLAEEYARHQAVAIQVQVAELETMFGQARKLFDEAHYAEAVEAFTRAAGKARYLSPRVDVSKIAEESEVYIQRSLQLAEQKRVAEQEKKSATAAEETNRLRTERERLLTERTQALYGQAKVLFEQHRYEEARKVADEILLKDPTNGAAMSLREAAVDASHDEQVGHAIKNRRVETERVWQESRAMSVPQSELVYMPRDRFEEVRSRTAATAIGGELRKPEPWEARIREAMNKKISFDFVETPLQDVISFISSLVDVTIVLDRDAIKDEAPTVTLRVNDMRLESALNWVLKLVGLKYTLRDEAIFVSKPDQIYDKSVLRMYDVTDLTIDIKNFQGRQQALASDGGYSSTGSQSGGFGGGGGGGSSSLGEDFFGSETDTTNEKERLTGESLVDFIKKTIAPGTWADDTGAEAF